MLNRSGISIPEIKINQKLKNILSRWMCFTLVIIAGIVVLIKLLFFQSGQKIADVKFSDNTLATYQNPYLFGFITDEVKGKNYYIINSDKDQLLSKIQNWFTVKNPAWERVEFKFPFVINLNYQLETTSPTWLDWETTSEDLITWIEFLNNWTEYKSIHKEFPLRTAKQAPNAGWILWIEILYLEPKLLVKLNDKKFAVWSDNIFTELKDSDLLSKTQIDTKSNDNTISNLTEIFTVETPQYLTWTNNLDWFFFDINLSNMIKITSLAKEEFWSNMTRFVYLVWSTRFAIFTTDEKTLYFNFPEWSNIEQQRETQISKYNILREKYSQFNKIWTVDLWALEENKVIIKYY